MNAVALNSTERGSAGYAIQQPLNLGILPGATALGTVRALNV
jgi:hypothetical protein